MTAALNLRSYGRGLYDTLLRQGGGRPFNMAPFPPILQSQFDCGTIFTLVRQPDGSGSSTIWTFDISMPEQNRTWEQTQEVLTGGSIVGPFPEPGGFRYRARAGSPAALLLFSPPHCHRQLLASENGNIDANPQWRNQAQDLFSQGYTEVYLVTGVWVTNRWAVDLRTADTQGDAEYTATTANGGQYNEHIAPNFEFNHDSRSGNQYSALYPGAPFYTVLALVTPIQQRGLGRYAPWLNPFIQKLRNTPRRFVRRVLRKPPSYPSSHSGYSTTSGGGSKDSDVITDTMFKLPLGGTFSLVEVISGEDSTKSEYSFESEGHREDFSFESFCTTLEQRFNVSDWKYALQSLFPPQGQLPIINLPPEFDFRRHTPGRAYSMPSTLSQSMPVPNRAYSLPSACYSYPQSPLPGYPSMPVAIPNSSSISSTSSSTSRMGVGWSTITSSPMYASPMSSPGIPTPPYLTQTSTSAGTAGNFDSKPSPYTGQASFLPAANYNAQPTQSSENAAYGIATVTAVPERNGSGYTGVISSPTFFQAAPRPPGW